MRLLLLAAAAPILGLFVGCASSATSDGMTIGARELAQLSAGAATLEQVPGLHLRDVRGGSSKVSDDEFRVALESSLAQAGLGLGSRDLARDLALDAELLGLEYPPGAKDMPAHLTVRYQVFSPDQEEPIFDHSIRSGYVMPLESAFTGVERLRLAIEGAARDNITILIRDLAEELGG